MVVGEDEMVARGGERSERERERGGLGWMCAVFVRLLTVARSVDAVDVAEGSRDSEHSVITVGSLAHRGKLLVDLPHLLRLSVELGRINVRVVNADLLAAGDAKLHLEEEVDLGHALKVVEADVDVLGVCGGVWLVECRQGPEGWDGRVG